MTNPNTHSQVQEKPDRRKFILKIDSKNNITYFNQSWLDFAKENNGESYEKIYIGQPLKKFIANPEVWLLYEMAIDSVRAGTKGEILWSFRCDSPECRRFMTMQISKDADDFIEFKSHIDKVEHRTSVGLFDPLIPRSSDCLTICSWCKKIKLGPDEWVEVEGAVETLKLFRNTELPKFTHGICPECHKRILQEIPEP